MAKAPPERKARPEGGGFVGRALNAIETVGNRLPDPAILFLLLLVLTWIASAILAPVEFAEVDPRSGEPLRIANQLTGTALATFLVQLVPTFTGFAPLGVVLVALLGVGVAEKTGFINAGLKLILGRTSPSLLTPMLILAAIVSHTAADAGYVLVIPLGGVIFYAAGAASARRHLGRLRGGLGRVLGQLHPFGHRSAAAGLHPAGRSNPRPRADGQSAEQPGLHRRLVAARHRRRLGT